MSKIKHSDNIFTNELTRNRRAWIDRALAGVKGKAEASGERRPKPVKRLANRTCTSSSLSPNTTRRPDHRPVERIPKFLDSLDAAVYAARLAWLGIYGCIILTVLAMLLLIAGVWVSLPF